MYHLRFNSKTSEHDLRLAIVEAGRIAYSRGLFTSTDGNISVRLGTDRIIITPAGYCKGRMEVDDLLVADMGGELIGLPSDSPLRASSELPMHLEVYRQRPDVRATIHAHPIFATTLTVADLPFPVDVLPEIMLTLGDVPTSAYATPSSHEDAEAIRDLILHHDAILLRQHGSLTVGRELEEALSNLERIEHVAEVFWRANMLGQVKRLPPEAINKLSSLRGDNTGPD